MDLLKHYFSFPGFFIFLAVSLAITIVIHLILWGWVCARNGKDYVRFTSLKEEYYELVFASTSTLFFTGIYFIMDFTWVPMSDAVVDFWARYNDFLLLGLLVISILIMNLLDRLIIPLKSLDDVKIGALRMSAMIYMLAIFAYIKFIYQDDNYDKIVFYFFTMLISRFVYLDASFASFKEACAGFVRTLPILGLVLLSTALLAFFGFLSGYLLTKNGVVVSLGIAHCFMIIAIFAIAKIEKHVQKKRQARPPESL